MGARRRAPRAIVVVDEHDEGLQEERAPTWHARDVAIERARRAGIPCVLLSPCPSLEALDAADRVVEPSRAEERAGWPILDVVDRRRDDPRSGLYSDRLRADDSAGGRSARRVRAQPEGSVTAARVRGVRSGGDLRALRCGGRATGGRVAL